MTVAKNAVEVIKNFTNSEILIEFFVLCPAKEISHIILHLVILAFETII